MTTVASRASSTAAPRVPGDLREGGAWTRSQAVKNALIAAAVHAALAILVPLPARLLRALGRAVGRLALALFGSARRIARANLADAFPGLAPRARRELLRGAYVSLGGHLGDALASLDARRPLVPLDVEPASLDLLLARPGDGARGVVFASAHLGPWERVAATLVARGVPMTVLARETYDPRLASVYERLRAARGVRAIYRGQAGAAARIVRTLRQGGVLGIPMDLRSRVPSVEVPLLGRAASTPVGPARIALRTGARVVVGTIAPSPGAAAEAPYRVTCTEIATSDLVPGTAGERILTARINLELSVRIRELPTEWVWMHDRFARDNLPEHRRGVR